MKSTILVLLTFFVASNLGAQGRRRSAQPAAPATLNDGPTIFDPTDPFAAIHWHAGSNAATPARPAAEPVPVSQLRIPSKAVKEFERSQKAFHSGDVPTSVEHLQRAVQIFPDFLQAHLALGLRFIQLGEYQKALTEHEAAVALDPRSALTHQDLSLTLLFMNRYQEAEAEARQSLDIDSQAVAAHYVLGRALIAQDRVTPEAMEMLRQSENVFPNASLVLALLHFRAGRTDQAIAELRNYLRAPADRENKRKAECWVAQLSQQPSPSGCPAEGAQPSFR
jgi:tetratricopeptide (TPR) repeat protein